MLSVRNLTFFLPKTTMVVRTLASSAQATDPIQKLFIDTIRDYSAKAKASPNGLVDSNPELSKKLNEEMERVANLYGVKNDQDIANLGLKFEETIPLDPINMSRK